MNTLEDMLKALMQVFPDGPSWPWRTRSAEVVWQAVQKEMEAHPQQRPAESIRNAFMQTGVPAGELTPEDSNMIALAARWKLASMPAPEKKQPPREPPMRKTVRKEQ